MIETSFPINQKRGDPYISSLMADAISAVIPGGVDSPFRSFAEVGGHTIFFKKGAGAYLYDVDNNCYIDYLGSWGPAVLGHAPLPVVTAVQKAVADGPLFGAPHALELELAKQVIAALPGMQKIRFVNSGTEAVMSALRLARGFTKRDLVVMFEGCYHGHSDAVLASQAHVASAGIPQATAKNTLLVPFNALEALTKRFQISGKEIACVIVEPVAGSMGVIPPAPGFLAGLRKLCSDNDSLLIFDEVLTGFRVAFGGAQKLYGVRPDLTCLGKILGGGMPIGAYGGRSEIMDQLQPLGNVYQAGTFSGNPVTMAGGVETLRLLSDPQVYNTLEKRSEQLFAGLAEAGKKLSASFQLQRVGSMFSILFAGSPVRNYQDSQAIDAKQFAKFFHAALKRGIYMPPSAVDAAAVSAAHSEQDIELTVKICTEALKEIL
jgi:glutamate-1-semialdehyde 2,1-aminomutase